MRVQGESEESGRAGDRFADRSDEPRVLLDGGEEGGETRRPTRGPQGRVRDDLVGPPALAIRIGWSERGNGQSEMRREGLVALPLGQGSVVDDIEERAAMRRDARAEQMDDGAGRVVAMDLVEERLGSTFSIVAVPSSSFFKCTERPGP